MGSEQKPTDDHSLGENSLQKHHRFPTKEPFPFYAPKRPFEQFPQMLFHHERRETRIIKDDKGTAAALDELAAALRDGWREDPFPAVYPQPAKLVPVKYSAAKEEQVLHDLETHHGFTATEAQDLLWVQRHVEGLTPRQQQFIGHAIFKQGE